MHDPLSQVKTLRTLNTDAADVATDSISRSFTQVCVAFYVWGKVFGSLARDFLVFCILVILACFSFPPKKHNLKTAFCIQSGYLVILLSCYLVIFLCYQVKLENMTNVRREEEDDICVNDVRSYLVNIMIFQSRLNCFCSLSSLCFCLKAL